METFELTTIPQLQEASEAFIASLDRYIDELNERKQYAQACRRVAAMPFGIDRREGVGTFGEMADNAKRSEYEGEGEQRTDDRIAPQGRPARHLKLTAQQTDEYDRLGFVGGMRARFEHADVVTDANGRVLKSKDTA